MNWIVEDTDGKGKLEAVIDEDPLEPNWWNQWFDGMDGPDYICVEADSESEAIAVARSLYDDPDL